MWINQEETPLPAAPWGPHACPVLLLRDPSFWQALLGGEEGPNPKEQGGLSSEVLGRPLAGLIPPAFRDTHQFVLHMDGGWEGIKFPQRLFPGDSGLGKPAPGTQVTWSSFLPNSTLAPKPQEPS